jgi:galactose-1-phosphate uridylyltransferase
MAPSERHGAEIGLNKVMHQWVIIAPHRGKRPRDFAGSKEPVGPVPSMSPIALFCPGDEDLIHASIPEDDAAFLRR